MFILYVATSLDGYIARANGDIDWLPSSENNEEDYGYNDFYNSIDALVMGSNTYEQILGFTEWAYPGKLSYILTGRNLSATRPDILLIKNGIEAVIEDTKKRNYQRIWLVGGAKIIASFIDRQLVDEYIITIIPIILGSGIFLYQSLRELHLNLIEVKSYTDGVVQLYYRNK